VSFEALATIAESAPVLLVVLDPHGACIWCNHEWSGMTGCSLADTHGSGWFVAVHPEDRATVRDASRSAAKFEEEVRIRRHDGAYRACLARAAPRHDRAGRFTGLVVSAMDLTTWRARTPTTAPLTPRFDRSGDDRILARLPARAHQLAVVRRLVAAWLAASGIATDDIALVVLAVSEAASNAIEHAYGPAVGWFELEAELAGRRITVAVRDGGRWRSKPSSDRGRGLGLMARLMDEFETRRSERGTEVWMRRTLAGKEAFR
jgi:PAS domain S-box-containing protein